MLDQERWIGAQAIMKSLIEGLQGKPPHIVDFEKHFEFYMGLMEKYATIPEGEEFVSTEISIPKQFWNLDSKAQADWLTEWGKPLPVVNKVGRKEWFVFAKRANIEKVIRVFNDRENNFDDMVKLQEAKK